MKNMKLLRKLLNRWLAFAGVIGRINTLLLLTLLYILVLTPVGILSRLLGKNPIAQPVDGSMWVERKEEENLERQF